MRTHKEIMREYYQELAKMEHYQRRARILFAEAIALQASCRHGGRTLMHTDVAGADKLPHDECEICGRWILKPEDDPNHEAL